MFNLNNFIIIYLRLPIFYTYSFYISISKNNILTCSELSVYLLQNLWINHKIAIPVVSLRTFIVKLLTGSRTTASTLQLALIFLLRLRTRLTMQSIYQQNMTHTSAIPQSQSNTSIVNDIDDYRQINQQPSHYVQCGRRMFLVSLILAYKVLQDKSYSSQAWSKISGLSSAEITSIEREVLEKMGWDLTVSRNTFTCWTCFLHCHIPVEIGFTSHHQRQQPFQSVKPNPCGDRLMTVHGLPSPDNHLSM